jgi:hypothetical protein
MALAKLRKQVAMTSRSQRLNHLPCAYLRKS